MGLIREFQGTYRFLSNFWKAEVEWEGMMFPTVENAYQAAKTKDLKRRIPFQTCPPGDAKRLGRRLTLREDWDEIKLDVMKKLIYQKFTTHPELKLLLSWTGDDVIQEGNRWGDTFWGVDLNTGKGKNHLGKILMEVRKAIRNPQTKEQRLRSSIDVLRGNICRLCVTKDEEELKEMRKWAERRIEEIYTMRLEQIKEQTTWD